MDDHHQIVDHSLLLVLTPEASLKLNQSEDFELWTEAFSTQLSTHWLSCPIIKVWFHYYKNSLQIFPFVVYACDFQPSTVRVGKGILSYWSIWSYSKHKICKSKGTLSTFKIFRYFHSFDPVWGWRCIPLFARKLHFWPSVRVALYTILRSEATHFDPVWGWLSGLPHCIWCFTSYTIEKENKPVDLQTIWPQRVSRVRFDKRVSSLSELKAYAKLHLWHFA